MTTDMTCAAFAETLADFLERDVPEATRAAVELHAVTCVDCGALLADLRALRVDASRLPELTPGRDLWAGIAARIDAQVIPIGAKRDGGERSGVTTKRATARPGRWTRMAVAAALLIAATSATTYYLTVRTTGRGSPLAGSTTSASLPSSQLAGTEPTLRQPDSVDSAPPATRSVADTPHGAARNTPLAARNQAQFASARPTAEQVYDNEIGRLRAIVERRRAQLDPVTISLVERNLKVIDDAIAQCRSALAKDPASRFLMESLNNALENKVELLRTAALLPSRT
jgi:hypothetical protein